MRRVAVSLLIAGIGVFPLWAELDGTPDVPYKNIPYNGRFTFPRLRFTPSWWGPGPHYWGLDLKWNHDYPRAEAHLMKMLSELTFVDPNQDGGNIYRIDDPELFKYPWAYVCEVGFWRLTDEEAKALRNYLLKGGFLVVDDFMDRFPGGYAWQNFVEGFKKAMPEAQLVELEPTHPIFDSFFHIENPQFLRSPYPVDPIYYGVFEDNDPHKRLMVIVNYNHDVGEFWEWSDTNFVPVDISNEAYKLGLNYVIYGMTH